MADAAITTSVPTAPPMESAVIRLRRRKRLVLALRLAVLIVLIGGWEGQGHLTPSQPQVSIGAGVQRWLQPLDA